MRNPYAPGAGANPPELAGRDAILREAEVALERHRLGRPNQSIILSGLRGTGKTVLLTRLEERAAEMGVAVVSVEASNTLPLPVVLIPQIRAALMEMSRRGKANGFDIDSLPGLADNGDLVSDLQVLLGHVAVAARASGTAVALFVDEFQYLPEDEMGALLTALHGATQDDLPLVIIGAGLPQVAGALGDARTYAERMFIFFDIGPLTAEDAACALTKPADDEGVEFEDEALEVILERTGRYPYFLQQWGRQAWLAAEESPISVADVEAASATALDELDRSFFRIRMDKTTPTEERYLRAMAEVGPGPRRSADVAEAFGTSLSGASPHRAKLIELGLIWSPKHGYVDFTVPLFDEYLRRTQQLFS